MIVSVQKILMPKLGESVTEGTINAWLVKEGDFVNKYDPIAEVMTDKVNAEVPSSYSGTIKEIVVPEGQTVAVDDLICYIETDEQEKEKSEGTEVTPEEPGIDTDEHATTSTTEQTASKVARPEGARYSPAVMRLAGEHNIDLTTVEGTGLG